MQQRGGGTKGAGERKEGMDIGGGTEAATLLEKSDSGEAKGYEAEAQDGVSLLCSMLANREGS